MFFEYAALLFGKSYRRFNSVQFKCKMDQLVGLVVVYVPNLLKDWFLLYKTGIIKYLI